MKVKIWVATFETNGAFGLQKVFLSKIEAKNWLKNQYNKYFDGIYTEKEMTFKQWQNYGAFTAKIKSFNIEVELPVKPENY